jgi:hypothetical protein
MKKISGSNIYFKKVFPSVWFGFLTLFMFISIKTGATSESFIFLLVPTMMGVMGVFIFKKLVWSLADEVYDCGSYLKFIKGGQEQQLKLKDILNISGHHGSPERIVISARGDNGQQVEYVFNPPIRLAFFSTHPIVIDLIDRVDKAKRL